MPSQKVVPTGVATGLDIGLSNLSLKLITLSFYSRYINILVSRRDSETIFKAMCKSSS